MKVYRNIPNFSDLNIDHVNFVDSSEDADFCFYDHSTWDQSKKTEKDILISSKDDEFNVLNLLANQKTYHLIGNSPDIEGEINRTLSILSSGCFWDPAKGFPNPSWNIERSVKSTEDIKQTIDAILSEFDFNTLFSEQEDIIRLLANELLVNAFFHRPQINPDRTATIVLPKSIPIQLSRNEKSILLRVEDYNRGFAYDKLLGSLSRGFKEKKPRHDTGGAGLGFYFVFKMANQVIVNIKKTGTEIICMFDANKRYKEYMKRVSSLHYFKGNK